MNANLLKINEVVYNFKMNYIRVYIGPSLTDWLIENFETPNDLKNFLSPLLPAIKRDIKLVLDASSEGEVPYIDLGEKNQLHRLDWIYNWKKKCEVPTELFEIWTSDFLCKENNGKYGELFTTMNQYKHNVAYVLDNTFLEDRRFERKFICAMSRRTEERMAIWKLIESDENLKNNTYYSFNFRENGVFPSEDDKNYPSLSLERYPNEPDETQRTQFAGFFSMNTSVIQIACETSFYKNNKEGELNKPRFFTEKTFRPLGMCQPFIYVSNRGMLSKLKSYGFKTFDKWWDESYDDMEDNERLKAISNLITELNKKSIEELSQMYKEMIPILKHNFDNLFKLEENYYEFHITHNYNEFGKHEYYYHHYFKIFN